MKKYLILVLVLISGSVLAVDTSGLDKLCANSTVEEVKKKCDELKNMAAANQVAHTHVLQNNTCVAIVSGQNPPIGGLTFASEEECKKKITKNGVYFKLVSNKCERQSAANFTDDGITIFEKEDECKKKIVVVTYSDADFDALATDSLKKSYCGKFTDRRMKSGKCIEKSGFGKAMGSAGAFLGDKISDIDGSSILSGASSLADDMGLKDSAKKKITFRQNPDKFFQEYCDDPRLDNDCMTVIKKPGKEDIYLEKLCDGDPVKSPDCEAKFMALHKDNAKTKYITDVCEDAPTDKLKCRQYYKEVKGAEKFYIDLCADDKAKEPECNKEKLLAVDPSKKIFEKIYCADDEEKRDARCPKIVEEKEDEESDQEEPEEESEGESDEDSDEDF